ncbi:metalloprotease, partial [Spiromyces aspiralis]
MSKPSTNTADSETNDAVSLCREHTTSFIASHCRLQNIMDPNYRLNTLQSGLEYLEYVGEPIEMLPKDSRPCRLLKLCNMMEVLIIEDASSKRSAVTMSMDVGSACDPPALPGLAHLCMHALLLRSDAGEATLEEYLKMHKGSIDLRISAERSLYSFEVANPGFADALSMFSKCFISPSFEPKNVGHKAELIDAIRRRDLEDDAKRAKMVCQLLAADSEGEPLRLSPGSCNSLAASARDSGVELRDKVSEFFHARYSAGIMKLAVVGHLPLDELTELVVTEFSRVPNKGITSDFHFGNPCSQAALGKAVFLHSVDCARRMHIYFPSLYLSEALSASTLSYITYLLNDQGEDSPFYALYHKGWVEHIFCQYEILGRASIPLQIGIDLTEDGLDNYQSVLGMVFTVLTLLARKTPDEAIFGELKQIRAGYFRMCPQKPPLDLAQLAARLMNHTHTPKYRLFSGNILLHEFSPKDVKESMEHLAPENCIVVIIGDHRLDCVEMEGFQEGAECSVLPIRECIKSCPLEQIEAFAAAARQPRQETQSLDYDLLLNNNIRSMRKYELEPTLLVHTKFGEVWYSKNTNLSNNEGKLGIEIIPPNSVKDLPNMTNITIVFSLLLKKRLKDIIDSKEHNSVEYALRPKHSGLSILVKGSIFKMLDVVKLILKHIQLAEFSEAEFATALSDHIVNNSQAVGGLPDNHANKLANFIQDTSKAGNKTCTELETLDFDMFKHRVSEMFANFYFKVLAAGDFDQDMPLSVYDALINTLNPQPMATEDIHPNSFLQQNVGRYIVQAKLPAGSYT